MNLRSKFTGTGVALITPFNKKFEIDFAALERIIEHVINGGVDYIVTLGTTGETPVLSKEEKLEVINFTKYIVNKRIPLVVGIGGNNTAEIKSQLQDFNFNGYDAVLSVSPYYNKPNQEGIYLHYKTIANECPVPVILYNVPGRTGSNISAETSLRLAEIKNIIGIKEASGNFDQIMKIIKCRPKNFLVISGDDLIALPIVAAGADGVISVIANAFPKNFSKMIRNALQGKMKQARKLHYQIDEFTRQIFADSSPAGIKCLMELMGMCSADVRMPSAAVTEQVKRNLSGLLKNFNL